MSWQEVNCFLNCHGNRLGERLTEWIQLGKGHQGIFFVEGRTSSRNLEQSTGIGRLHFEKYGKAIGKRET